MELPSIYISDQRITSEEFRYIEGDSLDEITQRLNRKLEANTSNKRSLLHDRVNNSNIRLALSQCIDSSKFLAESSHGNLRLTVEEAVKQGINGDCTKEKSLLIDALKLLRIMNAINTTDVEGTVFASTLLVNMYTDLSMRLPISKLPNVKNMFTYLIKESRRYLCKSREHLDKVVSMLPGRLDRLWTAYSCYTSLVYGWTVRASRLVTSADTQHWTRHTGPNIWNEDSKNSLAGAALIQSPIKYPSVENVLCDCDGCVSLLRFMEISVEGSGHYYFGNRILVPTSSLANIWDDEAGTPSLKVIIYVLKLRYQTMEKVFTVGTPDVVMAKLHAIVEALKCNRALIDKVCTEACKIADVPRIVEETCIEGSQKIADGLLKNIESFLSTSHNLATLKQKKNANNDQWILFYHNRKGRIYVELLNDLFNELALVDARYSRQAEKLIVDHITALCEQHLGFELKRILEEIDNFYLSANQTAGSSYEYVDPKSCIELARDPPVLRAAQCIRDVIDVLNIWKVESSELLTQIKTLIIYFVTSVSKYIMCIMMQDIAPDDVSTENNEVLLNIVCSSLFEIFDDLVLPASSSKRQRNWVNNSVRRYCCIFLPFVNDVLRELDPEWIDIRIFYRGYEPGSHKWRRTPYILTVDEESLEAVMELVNVGAEMHNRQRERDAIPRDAVQRGSGEFKGEIGANMDGGIHVDQEVCMDNIGSAPTVSYADEKSELHVDLPSNAFVGNAPKQFVGDPCMIGGSMVDVSVDVTNSGLEGEPYADSAMGNIPVTSADYSTDIKGGSDMDIDDRDNDVLVKTGSVENANKPGFAE